MGDMQERAGRQRAREGGGRKQRREGEIRTAYFTQGTASSYSWLVDFMPSLWAYQNM